MPVSDPAAPPPAYVRLGPAEPATPLVIAVPHAGRHYPASIEPERAVAWPMLETLEDRYADRLIAPAVAAGAVAIVATHARAWLDLNREEGDRPDLAPGLLSARARAGLGLIPTRAGGRDLWRGPILPETVAARLAAVHAPYHRAIAGALAAAHARHGFALLVDAHSMPSLGRPGRPAARIVLGDRHGASASAGIVAAMAAVAVAHGIPIARNAPYAGAYTLAAHGRPMDGVHATQIEVDRTLYLGPDLREPSGRLSEVAALFAALCWAGVGALTAPSAIAAE